MTGSPISAKEIAAVIRDAGLLLQSDPAAPSAVGMLAGGPVAGSWWGRPDGRAIYRGLGALDDDPDIAAFKLLGGKVTLVHRRLWPALAAIGSAKAAWQMEGLSPAEHAALALVEAQGDVPARALPGVDGKAAAKVAAKLEARLLACVRQVHTAQGSHAKILTAWSRWCALNQVDAIVSVEAARREIEEAVVAVYAKASRAVAPPWPAASA